MAPVLVWLRNDLRLDDNPALAQACASGVPVLVVYLAEPGLGAASKWWLHHSLEAFSRDLAGLGLKLHLQQGDPLEWIPRLARQAGAGAVYWNARIDGVGESRDRLLCEHLEQSGVKVHEGALNLLQDVRSLRNRSGAPWQVFTPFWRHCLALPVAPPLPAPRGLISQAADPVPSLPLDALCLLPSRDWARAFSRHWQPGSAGAKARLLSFLAEGVEKYDMCRDFPSMDGVSKLSAHLHFGELGARRVYHELRRRSRETGVFPADKGSAVFLSELGWREFAQHLLFHFPSMPTAPLREKFARMPWKPDPGGRLLKAWQRGQTGYPIVDAGMRELWASGWMHNRVRMIAASFLTKHLLQPWQLGLTWFHDTLVDADAANNSMGWQWVAGCGADAAPFFRIFNPVLQGRRFDPEGTYIRRWVPELSGVSNKWIHEPWNAPVPPPDYPAPLVEQGGARAEALAAFAQLGDA